MTTLHIEFNEAIADAARRKAQAQGKTLETWAAEVLAKEASSAGSQSWIRKFLASADRNAGHSQGQKWSRDELYDR